MAPNHGREPLGSILGPMGSHWGQKMGQNRKKLPFLKIRIFDYSAVIDFGKKANLRLWRQITLGNPWGPSWVRWGPIGAKKWVKTVKNCYAPKSEFLTTPWSSIWEKIELTVMMPNHGGDPLGPSWDQWGPIGAKKWIKTVKNYHAPKFEFWLLRGHQFGQKIVCTVMMPNHGGALLGPSWDQWGPIGAKKMGQNRKKLPCPKIRIFHYSAVIALGKKSNWRLWREITVGTP